MHGLKTVLLFDTELFFQAKYFLLEWFHVDDRADGGGGYLRYLATILRQGNWAVVLKVQIVFFRSAKI